MFAPAGIAKAMAVAPEGAQGMNTIRGVLACVALLVLGITTAEGIWLIPVAVVMGAVAAGRLIGIVFDGFHKAVVPPLLVEVVIAGVLSASAFVLGTS